MEEEVKKLLEGMAVEASKIKIVEVVPAKEIYKEKAKQPDRPTLRITAENGARMVTSLPNGMRYDGGNYVVEDMIKAQRSIRAKQSGFGAFLRRYGHYPNVGTEVNTTLDTNGFPVIMV